MKILILPFVLLFGYSNAQVNITGTVVDENKAVVEKANILLIDDSDDHIFGPILSDENGEFEIEVKEMKKYSLSIKLEGYRNLIKNIEAESNPDLGEIVVKNLNKNSEEGLTAEANPDPTEDEVVQNDDAEPKANIETGEKTVDEMDSNEVVAELENQVEEAQEELDIETEAIDKAIVEVEEAIEAEVKDEVVDEIEEEPVTEVINEVVAETETDLENEIVEIESETKEVLETEVKEEVVTETVEAIQENVGAEIEKEVLTKKGGSVTIIEGPVKVTGKVVDDNKAPIEFANVYVKDFENDFIVEAGITDVNGLFALDLKQLGNYGLVVSYLGFTDWTVKLDPDQSMDFDEIVLSRAENMMSTVEVTAERKIIERKEGKLVFNVGKSPLKTGYNGIEVLERAPNIFLDGDDNIIMRNKSAKVLINGRISNLSGENLVNYIRNLRSDEIENIEVQTHMTAKLDAENAGGVVNIVLKKNPKGFESNIRSDYVFMGGGDYHNFTGVNFSYGEDRWNIYGNYDFRNFTQVSPIDHSTRVFESNNLIVNDWSLDELRKNHIYKFGFVTSLARNHEIGLEAQVSSFVYQYDTDASINVSNNGSILENGFANFDGERIIDLYSATFNYNFTLDTLNSKIKLFADYSEQDYLTLNQSDAIYDEDFFQDNSERNRIDLQTSIYSLQGDLEKNFKNGFKIEAGSKLSFVDRTNQLVSETEAIEGWNVNENSNRFTHEENIIGGYASMSKNIGDKTFIQGGVRVENTELNRVELSDASKIEQNYTDWFPSFYVSRNFADNSSISANYSKNIQRPHFSAISNFLLKVNDFRYERGNPALRPEYLHKYELSYKRKIQSVSLFYNKTNDAVKYAYTFEDDITFGQYVNLGTETEYGVDYNIFGNIQKWWYIKTNLGLSRREIIDYNNLGISSGLIGNVNIATNFEVTETFKIGVSGWYRSAFYNAFCKILPNYSVDLNVEKVLLENKLSVRLTLTDLFNNNLERSECVYVDFDRTARHKEKTRTIGLTLSYKLSGENSINKRKIDTESDIKNRL